MRYELIDDFLSQDECNQIIEMAKRRLQKSFTWDVTTGSSIVNEYRKSDQMFFNKRENPLISSIEDRVANLTGYPVENQEGLQIVFYRETNYYYGHWDYFAPEYEGNQAVINRGGQRVVTVLMYLNNMYANFITEKVTPEQEQEMGEKAPIGDTWFPRMNLSVRPDKAGKAIYWHNMKQDGITVDPTTYHCGRPVPRSAVKWICTCWIRSGKFT